jgi:ATP-binding cassette subfamily C protein
MQGAFSNAPRLIVETAAILLLLGLAASTYLGGGPAGNALLPGFLIYAVLRLAPSSSRVLGALSHLSFGLAAMKEIAAALNAIDATNAKTAMLGQRVPEPFQTLEFDEVGFTYRKLDEMVVPTVDSVSFHISSGEFVGIVGETGSGKTTILDLLLGLLTPQEGQILLNSRSLTMCAQEWWAMVGVVSQDVFVLGDSVAANVAFGIDPEAIDHVRVWRALDLAQIGDVVRSWPARLDSELGERGIAISGGERQRVGIARALYHIKEVLVLDEATSALDTATEVRLLRALREEMRGRSLIMVTHRIEALRTFDRIIMVENGTVVAQGTYDALADRSPSFQALIRSAD